MKNKIINTDYLKLDWQDPDLRAYGSPQKTPIINNAVMKTSIGVRKLKKAVKDVL